MRVVLFFLINSLLFFSCVTPRKTHYLQEPDAIIPSYPEVSMPPDYTVQFNDELFIRVMTLNPESKRIFNPQSSGGASSNAIIKNTTVKGLQSYTVYDDGTIDFPYVGEIHVAGKTTREIKFHIEDKLKDYVRDCSVDVGLVNSYVNVLTNTSASRVDLITERMTIFQVLAIAGDLGSYAKRSEIKILRETTRGTEMREFDLRSKDIIHSDFYYVQPNDLIYVKDFNGQFFRLNNFMTVLTTTTATISFGFFMWKLIDMWIPNN